MNEMSYAQMRSNFEEKYREKILPIAKILDKDRKKTCLYALLVYSAIILIGYIFFLIFINYGVQNFLNKCADFFMAFVFVIFGICWAYLRIKKNFENKIKKTIMPVVCSCFENLEWSNSPFGSYLDIYINSNLLQNFDNINFDDCFKGSYNDVNYRIEEFITTRRQNKNDYIIFQGIVVSVEMNKRVRCNTVIKPKNILNSLKDWNLHRTKLEDVVFEEKFDVYTDDDVEARYLITPSLMERLNKMKLAFNVNNISAAFYANKFIIALSTKTGLYSKDLFSIGVLTKPLGDFKQFNNMFEEIYSIYNLINYFKLNQKIGL